MAVEWWAWAAVIGFILAMLVIDLFFFHRDAHEVSIREAATWSVIWIALSLAFGVIVWAWLGGPAAGEYFSGYLIEKSLSVDNLFVFALLLSYFAVPLAYQHRLLYWGVLGALVAAARSSSPGWRCSRPFTGPSTCSARCSCSRACGWRRTPTPRCTPSATRCSTLLRRVVPITDEYDGQRFFVRARRPPVGDAVARGARGDRDHRRLVRDRLDPRDLRDHARTRSWCSPRTPSRSSACARSTFSSPASSGGSPT